MTNRIPVFALIILALGLILPAHAASPGYFPAGPAESSAIHFEYAVYLLDKPAKSPLDALRKKLPSLAPGLKLVPAPVAAPAERQVSIRLETDVQKNYAPPSAQAMQYFSKGLSKEQVTALAKSQQAVIMLFGHPKGERWRSLRAANELVEQVARDAQGLIWDEETREIFSPDEWHKRRLANWQGAVPDLSKQTIIHAYKNGDYIRAITLGMRKFGLPDIYVADFAWSSSRPAGNLINALAQALAEGGSVQPGGRFDLNLEKLQQDDARKTQLSDLKPNAKKAAQLSLYVGVPDEGDPNNRLIRIDAERYPGPDIHAKFDAMLLALYGSQDSLTRIKHDELLLKTSAQARTRLPALRAAFAAGLQPGEFIQVKAPFKTLTNGQEWMWVEVTAWDAKGGIQGLLKNEPFEVPSLHAGQIVRVNEQEVFDYLRRYPDGREEGNETGKVILQMQGKTTR